MQFHELQSKMQLKKSKNQMVSYSSRSAEDILDKFKSLDSEWILTLEDKIEQIGEAPYFTSKAFCRKGDELYSATHTQPLSDPPTSKAGKPTMSTPQWQGAVSSYARKYALQGL
uniref:ERF family protein n=1 Tax=Brucella sp. CMUL 015 TaxID=1905697 RepID=UPI000A63D252